MVWLRNFVGRALVGGACLLPVAAVLVPSDANASVSIAVGYEQLVKDADVVAVITAGEAKSVWEDGRIYTYTRVHVDQSIAGDAGNGAEGWVRTMGGVVGEIGQMVDGEAVFTGDHASLLFLRKFNSAGVYEVSARAQGQYPIVVDPVTKLKKVTKSTVAGVLLPPKPKSATETTADARVTPQSNTTSTASGAAISDAAKIKLATEILHDRPLADVSRDIATAWKRLHTTPATK